MHAYRKQRRSHRTRHFPYLRLPGVPITSFARPSISRLRTTPSTGRTKRRFMMHNSYLALRRPPAYPDAPESVWHIAKPSISRASWPWKVAIAPKRTRPADILKPPHRRQPLSMAFHRPMRPSSTRIPLSALHLSRKPKLKPILDFRSLNRNRTPLLSTESRLQNMSGLCDVWRSGCYTTSGVQVFCLLFAPGAPHSTIPREAAGQRSLKYHRSQIIYQVCPERAAQTIYPLMPDILSKQQSDCRST